MTFGTADYIILAILAAMVIYGVWPTKWDY